MASFVFQLRKDLHYQNSATQLYNLQLAAYMSYVNMNVARSFINQSVTNNTATVAMLEQKANMTDVSQAITTSVDQAITTSVGDIVTNYIDTAVNNNNISQKITAQVEQALSAINIEKQRVLDEMNTYSYHGATGNPSGGSNIYINAAAIMENISSSLQLALAEISSEKNSAISEITALSQNVANQVGGLNNAVRDDLIKRIDYLFEMFYHSNSELIMELYPL